MGSGQTGPVQQAVWKLTADFCPKEAECGIAGEAINQWTGCAMQGHGPLQCSCSLRQRGGVSREG